MCQIILRGASALVFMRRKYSKACEVDAINGVVCDFGKKYGVATPINDRIVEIIKKTQNGELKAEKKNIHLFDDLL